MPRLDDEQLAQVGELIDEKLGSLASLFSGRGHKHDGFEEGRVLMSELLYEASARGTLPFNYKYAGETASDTLTGADASLINVAITPHKDSNILILAFATPVNDAATARNITFKIKRGSTTLATALVYLPAVTNAAETACLFAVESPSLREALTYDLTGVTDTLTPTVTNKAIMAIELPHLVTSTS